MINPALLMHALSKANAFQQLAACIFAIARLQSCISIRIFQRCSISLLAAVIYVKFVYIETVDILVILLKQAHWFFYV